MKYLYALVDIADAAVNRARGENERALEILLRAEAMALEMQMRPAVLEARTTSAQLLSEIGRTEEADFKLKEARVMVDEIAGLFEDDDLRGLYVQNALGNINQSS